MAPTREVLLETGHAFIASINAWTTESMLSVRAPTCIHYNIPASMGQAGRNNREFAAMVDELIPLLSNFKLRLASDDAIMIDVEARKVLLHTRGSSDSIVGPYENEYTYLLKLDEDGKLAEEIVEFIDSAAAAEFLKRLQEGTGKDLVRKRE